MDPIARDCAVAVALAPLALGVYAYGVYPLLLRGLALVAPPRAAPLEPAEWPFISITVPAFNEARAIRATIENLLAVDYPADRREILVVSDASTDDTDAIVGEYADRGVSLLRLAQRGGKTAAENAAGAAVRSDLIVNTDASVRVLPHALKPLVQAFGDPTVGVASGRDLSVGDVAVEGNRGESGYVGYEMTLRAWETRVGSIIGASGCFYGFRRSVHDLQFPDALSRDFASVLIARERGYRSVSVDAAVCIVPRTTSLDAEFRRKIRTMARGLSTLWYKRALLNPVRYGTFAWMLASHKLARWLVYLALPPAAVAMGILSLDSRWAAWTLVVVGAGGVLGLAGMRWRSGAPRPVALAGFAVASVMAGMLAWRDALLGRRRAMWDPTRRPT
ncbi:MAG TPA: glycosyltransferase [Gemmatimonadaceae bacterium]|jgi:cellulose synthase/poly-beta-1,6-N-acetylglucosamine synthase-like glycosyltransferase|nr:glycosyltransferase [Gemmatimonadaceae bacterium]